MIKTFATLLALIGLLFAVWWMGSEYVVLGQPLPITKTVIWNANDPLEGVLYYELGLDDEPRLIIKPLPLQTTLQGPVTFQTAGIHVIKVRATNDWGTSADATLTVTVAVPSPPTGIMIQ